MERLGKEVDEILSFWHPFQKCAFENTILTFKAPSGYPSTPACYGSHCLSFAQPNTGPHGQGLRFDLEVEARYKSGGVQRLGNWACVVF